MIYEQIIKLSFLISFFFSACPTGSLLWLGWLLLGMTIFSCLLACGSLQRCFVRTIRSYTFLQYLLSFKYDGVDFFFTKRIITPLLPYLLTIIFFNIYLKLTFGTASLTFYQAK